MPEYVYAAWQGPGAKIEGTLRAESEQEVAALLVQRGLHPVEIRVLGGEVERGFGRLGTSLVGRRRLNSRDRANLARQLADLLVAGMSVFDALVLLQQQTDSFAARRVLRFLQAAIRDGQTLSQAMHALPGDFTSVHVNLIRAGEGTGLLTMVLSQLASLEERDHELWTKVRTALLYPAITAGVGLVTVLVILNFVIPRLSSIFEETGQGLPLITRILLGFSTIAQWTWRYGVVLLLLAVLGARLLRRSGRLAVWRDRLIFHLPRVGRLVMTFQVARFTSILGSLLKNGVAMVPALQVTAETLDYRVVRERLERTVVRVNQGARLGEALDHEQALPRVVTGMIAVGERTGNLVGVLERIAGSQAQEADRMVKLLVGLVEPALILVMGLFVAFIVAAVILPIFQVNLAL